MSNENEPKRILYVEDEELLRKMTTDYLQRIGGFVVKCAVNGQEGVEMAASWNPDFILMDVRMPVMNGIEATRIIRSKPETADTPIFVITAYSDDEVITECEKAGINGYFTKPPMFKAILEAINGNVKQ